MKLTCDREKLSTLFSLVGGVASTRTPKAILSNVKLEAAESAVTLMATDLDVGVRVQLSGVEVAVAGTVILPVKSVGAILRESTDEQITVESEGTKTLIHGARSHFQLPTQDPSEFPPLPGFDHTQYHTISARFFREAARRTVYATDEESSRYALGGVFLELDEESMTAVGTDGRRMACQSGPARAVEGHATAGTTVIPTRAVHLIERVLADNDQDIDLAVLDNSIMLRSGSAVVFTRLVEGRYPRWRDVFPDIDNMIRIDIVVGPILSAVRQAAILTEKELPGVDFVFGEGKLQLFSHGADLGDSKIEMPISYEGEEIRVRLDPFFLLDFLKMLDLGQAFALYVRDPYTAVVCRTEDDYGYVIMPMAED